MPGKVILILILLLLLATAIALAQASTPGLAVDWWTVDGGGGISSGGPFSLHGSIGQADGGTLSGGVFSLQGGFWGAADYSVYLPLITR
jgi:hypothetical protein